MTQDEFELQLANVAEIQRDAGWAERSILSYSKEQREVFGKCLESLLFIGGRVGVRQLPSWCFK